jgi:hypothetical protein
VIGPRERGTTSPVSYAVTTACVLSRSPSLFSTRLTYVLTVSVTVDRLAISGLDRPSATASVLPLGVAQWLLRLTPAAGFAIQQSIPEYAHVLGHHSPQGGYYPLEPWAGLAVLGGYAVLALGLAVFQLRRRDA